MFTKNNQSSLFMSKCAKLERSGYETRAPNYDTEMIRGMKYNDAHLNICLEYFILLILHV